jgi:hypothetical protein
MARQLTGLLLVTSLGLAATIAQAAEPVASCPSFKALIGAGASIEDGS